MPYRSFRDAEGTEWEAWDVVPRREERRQAERRAEHVVADMTLDRRRGMERRLLLSRRSMEYDGGWLCFQSGATKRRLWPIPADWPRCDDARLLAYRDEARPVRRPSGRPEPADRPVVPGSGRPPLETGGMSAGVRPIGPREARGSLA